MPVALVIHGGGWINSDKSSLSPVSEVLARAGFAVFSINYRRLTEAPWPACREDCQTAFQKLRSGELLDGYGVEPSRFVIAGASAGGHLALMTALSQPAGQVDASLVIAPPASLEVNMATSDRFLFSAEFYEMFFGHAQPVTKEEMAAASPLSLVTEASPPLWLVHSRNDLLVPPEQSEKLVAAYRKNGRSVREYWFDGPDADHGLWRDNAAPVREMTPAFEAGLSAAVSGLCRAL